MHIFCHTEDALKLEFCLDAMDAPSPFDDGTEVPESIRDAIRYDHAITSCSVAFATAQFSCQVVLAAFDARSDRTAGVDDTLDRREGQRISVRLCCTIRHTAMHVVISSLCTLRQEKW